MTSSMAGSWMERSATSYAAATAATIGAALASVGKLSHCRGPSTRRVSAPGTLDRRGLVDQVDDQRAGGAAVPVQLVERAVEDGGAVVDHDHPAAQRLDVLQVVGGQQERGAALLVERAEELAQPALAHDVQPDRGLVEVEDLRVVQQRGRDVAAHPLAEAELADRRVEQVAEVEQVEELVEVGAVAVVGDPVDLAQQLEGVAQREVPPQRGALAEHDADPAGQLRAAPARLEPGDAEVAGRWAPGCR